jgi:OOP family OmpA-OmpF porin
MNLLVQGTKWSLIVVAFGALTMSPAVYGFELGEVRPGPHEALDINQIIVIVDASASMAAASKFDDEMDLLEALAGGMPSGDYDAGLDSFGERNADWELNPLAPFSRGAMGSAADRVEYIGGKTPLEYVLSAQVPELDGKEGRGVILLFTDGKAKRNPVLDAVHELDEAHGDLLCVYTVQLGQSKRGAKLLEEVSQVTGCGASWHADEVNSESGMTELIRAVFFGPDADGDGVADRIDECPGTPEGVEVYPNGCPVDTDGDGVYDYLDKCPGTPKGAKVDSDGCWDLANINFDTNKHDVKAEYNSLLNEVARVLKRNPGTKLAVSGHTDSDSSNDYNQALSERRTGEVIDQLVERGVARGALIGKSSGEETPLRPNDSESNKHENRRVELSVDR